jgi:hypothetical protein
MVAAMQVRFGLAILLSIFATIPSVFADGVTTHFRFLPRGDAAPRGNGCSSVTFNAEIH